MYILWARSIVPRNSTSHRARWFMVILVFLTLGSEASGGQCTFPSSGSRKVVRYSFEPILSDDKMALRITLEFPGSHSGEAELEIPSSYAGQRDLTKAFTELKALSPETTLSDSPSPSKKILRFPADTLVRISYVLVKDWNGRLDSGTRFRPILERSYFQILADTALIRPKLDPATLVDVRFDWQKLPSDWSLATSFGVDHRCQSFQGNWSKVYTALFVGGDYRIHHSSVAGRPLILAIRGKWSFTDDQWISQVGRIIASEREFWHDNDFPYYLVTLAPLDQDEGSTGGSAYTDAFMMHLSRKASLSYVVLSILAHEVFHGWNPYKMGRVPGHIVYWFTEGFTVYYTDRMLFRVGLLSLSEYVDRTNNKLREYEFSSARNVSNRELVARYDQDNSLSNVQSERGMMVALWLDSRIRQQSKNRASLDMVMFKLARSGSKKGIRLTSDRILSTAGKYLNGSDRLLLQQYVEDGTTIPALESALGPCVHAQQDRIPEFDLGMDAEALRSKHVVAGVKPDSEAFKAGLRDGQQVIRTSMSWNDTSKPVRLTVHAADGDHIYEYYPLGRLREIPQYHVAPSYSSASTECISALLPVNQKRDK